MGARLYNQTTGLFTSTDPIYGGNTTSYGYPTDPINQTDLDGNWLVLALAGAAEVGAADSWNPSGWAILAAVGAVAGAYYGSRYIARHHHWHRTRRHHVVYKKAHTEKGNRRARYGGSRSRSKASARSKAKRYAKKHPHNCKYRGTCSSGDHYHVDKYSHGKKIHTFHYYWKER